MKLLDEIRSVLAAARKEGRVAADIGFNPDDVYAVAALLGILPRDNFIGQAEMQLFYKLLGLTVIFSGRIRPGNYEIEFAAGTPHVATWKPQL